MNRQDALNLTLRKKDTHETLTIDLQQQRMNRMNVTHKLNRLLLLEQKFMHKKAIYNHESEKRKHEEDDGEDVFSENIKIWI